MSRAFLVFVGLSLFLASLAAPGGLTSASTTKLFTSFLYDANNDSPSAATSPPISGAASFALHTAVDPALSTCVFGEPSLLGTASALYLAVQCEKLGDPGITTDDDRTVVLLRCGSPCAVSDPAAWTYVRTIFTKADAVAVDSAFTGGFTAPALAESESGVHLIVTPAEDPGVRYRGCRVYRFADLSIGALVQSGSVPSLVASTGPTRETFNGACAFTRGAASGTLRSELGQADPPWDFRILMTRIDF